jgi:Putative prokaryotic signal transducing protein
MAAVRLTVVATQGEAEVICSMLRSEGIKCGDRAADGLGADRGAGFGGWREVLVDEDDLDTARELIEP